MPSVVDFIYWLKAHDLDISEALVLIALLIILAVKLYKFVKSNIKEPPPPTPTIFIMIILVYPKTDKTTGATPSQARASPVNSG